MSIILFLIAAVLFLAHALGANWIGPMVDIGLFFLALGCAAGGVPLPWRKQ